MTPRNCRRDQLQHGGSLRSNCTRTSRSSLDTLAEIQHPRTHGRRIIGRGDETFGLQSLDESAVEDPQRFVAVAEICGPASCVGADVFEHGPAARN